MSSAAHPVAVRLVSRHASELHLSGIAALERWLPDAGEGGIVALIVLRVCLPDWVADERIVVPACPQRSTTIHAIATSLGRPYATIHRLVAALVARGTLVATDAGVALSGVTASGAAVIRYIEDAHDILLRLIDDLAAAGQRANPPLSSRRISPLAILNTTLDIFLMPFEQYRGQIGSYAARKLWLGITTLAVRHITTDPVLNARYAVHSTPDSERRGVPTADLCRLLSISATTAWRHCTALAAAGLIARRGTGWVIRADQLREAAMESNVQAAVHYYLRRIDDLVAAGLDPVTLPYRRGRPALLARTAGVPPAAPCAAAEAPRRPARSLGSSAPR